MQQLELELGGASHQARASEYTYWEGDRVTLLPRPASEVWEIVALEVGANMATVRCLPPSAIAGSLRKVPLWRLRPSCNVERARFPEVSQEQHHPSGGRSDSPDRGERPRSKRHTSASGWIEKYLVQRRWEHHKYCWQPKHKGKKYRLHIPPGKLLAVRRAIAKGESPLTISKMLTSKI